MRKKPVIKTNCSVRKETDEFIELVCKPEVVSGGTTREKVYDPDSGKTEILERKWIEGMIGSEQVIKFDKKIGKLSFVDSMQG